ncbi:hypothetical protein [Deinococcus sp.]|uniref:hypothetical protein n=1 Tax=Deinococcus sp. TaxID=47478 RepID=UPI00391B9FA6
MPRSAPPPDDLTLAQLRATFAGEVVWDGAQVSSTESIGRTRVTPGGQQRLDLRAQWHRRSWRLSMEADTRFDVQLDGRPMTVTFRTTYARLTGQDIPWVQLLPGASEHETVQQVERLRAQCDEALFPWLDQVQTPAGLVEFVALPLNSLRLMSAAVIGPFRPAHLVAALLPASEAADAQARLQEAERLTRLHLREREQFGANDTAPAG